MSRNGFPESPYWVSVTAALQRLDAAGGPPRSFLILGAGMAGLAAAWELSRRGHTVEVLESADRPGGRIFTRQFQNGSYGECGAMRVPLAHDYTHHYLREAGIPESELRRFHNSRGNGFLDIRGTTVREADYRDLLPLFPGLSDDERNLVSEQGPGALLGQAMGPLFLKFESRFADLLAGDFSDPELADLDRITWRSYLETRTDPPLTPDAVELLGAMLSLAAVWHWSMATILRDEVNQIHPLGTGWSGVFCEVPGGLGRLPTLLAAQLPDGMIRYNAKVIDIERHANGGGTVYFEDTRTGGLERKPFERLLCTLPFPVLRGMKLATFSAAKRAAIQGLHYASSTKVLLNYDTRWWQESPLDIAGGRSISDRPEGKVQVPRQTYYPNDVVGDPCGPDLQPEPTFTLRTAGGVDLSGLFGQYVPAIRRPAPSGRRLAAAPAGTLLAAYTIEAGARALCDDIDGAVERAVAIMESIHSTDRPRTELRETQVWCWDQYPWALGAFALTPPTDLLDHFASAKQEEGPVYFAGDHVSIAPAWIQGSLESTLREVARMLETT